MYTCNICSLISSFGFIQILYKYIDILKLFYIELISCLFIIYILTIIFLLNFTYTISANIFINITGTCAMFSSLSSYFSPLLIVTKVINTKDPSLIYLPQAIVGTINLSCWLVYGILINDIYQIITNSLGLGMCLFQVFIYLLFSI